MNRIPKKSDKVISQFKYKYSFLKQFSSMDGYMTEEPEEINDPALVLAKPEKVVCN